MYPFTFDVKEMFTNLDHNQIREALNFLLSFYKVIQVDQVYVSQNSRKCFLNKPPQSGFTKISFQDMCNFVEFDLNLSFSALGKNIILHQKIGIPMGSPLSPALARLCVSYNEIQKFRNFNFSNFTHAGRCTDDMLVIIASTSLDNAKFICKNFVDDLYKGGLEIEEEEIHSSLCFDFVGHTVFKDFQTFVKNPNFESIVEKKHPKKNRYTHASSNVQNTVFISTMIGEMTRACNTASSPILLLMSLILLFKEFIILGHQESNLFKAYQITKNKQRKLHAMPNIRNIFSMAREL